MIEESPPGRRSSPVSGDQGAHESSGGDHTSLDETLERDGYSFVVRCDGCERYVNVAKACLSYRYSYDLPDGRIAVLAAVHCSHHCAEQTAHGISRG